MPVSVTDCLLLSVNTLATLLVPTFVAGNVLLAGVSVTATVPVPESATVCGLPGALSVRVTAPVRDPNWVGVKVTSILQVFPAASVLPQGLLLDARAKSPLAAMLVIFNVAVPLLVRVTLFALLVDPTPSFPNARDVGDRVTTGPLPFVTVSCNVVVCVREPDTPVIVTVEVPVPAVP